MTLLRFASLASLKGRRRLFFLDTSKEDGLELRRRGRVGETNALR